MWNSLHNAQVSSRRLSVVQRLSSSFCQSQKPPGLFLSSFPPRGPNAPPLGPGSGQLAQGRSAAAEEEGGDSFSSIVGCVEQFLPECGPSIPHLHSSRLSYSASTSLLLYRL